MPVYVLYHHTAGGCNYTVILDGWFGDLADLRQEDPAIASYLLDWISTMVRRRTHLAHSSEAAQG